MTSVPEESPQFLLRGLEKVELEWELVLCALQKICAIARACRSRYAGRRQVG
jgi:hypothetical protein